MNLRPMAIDTPVSHRHDGWTPARRAKFLERLTTTPDVRRACAAVGLSRQSAYRLRARDADFAAAWADAQRKAHEEATRSFIAALPEFLRRTPSDSSTSCHLRPPPQAVGASPVRAPGSCHTDQLRVTFTRHLEGWAAHEPRPRARRS